MGELHQLLCHDISQGKYTDATNAHQTISLLKQMKGCYVLTLSDEHDRGLADLADQLAVAVMGQTLAPDPLTAVQIVLPISANIEENKKYKYLTKINEYAYQPGNRRFLLTS